MASHGFVVTDLSGLTKAFVEAHGPRLTRRINGACHLTFTCRTDDPGAQELLIGKRAVKFYRDGVLRFFGVIGEPFVDGPDEVQINAYDPFFFLDRAFIGGGSAAPVVYSATDAGAIAWDLIDDLTYETHMRQGTLTTSINRDRTYEAGKSVAEAIAQLSEVDNGFFFRIDALDGGGAGFASFEVEYPTPGTDRADVRFEYGDGTLGNIDKDSLEVERFLPVNEVVVKGSGEGEAVPLATATDAASQTEYGTWPKWLELSDVADVVALGEHADEELRAHPPVALRFSTVTRDDGLGPTLFDDFDVGDTVRVLIDNGRTRISQTVRVNQVTLELNDDSDAEQLTGIVLESPTPQEQTAGSG